MTDQTYRWGPSERLRPDVSKWLADPKVDSRNNNKSIGKYHTRRNTKRTGAV
jgi:hypothetical protein